MFTEQFVAACNIERFEAMLKDETNPTERALLESMLAEQQDDLRKANTAIPVTMLRRVPYDFS